MYTSPVDILSAATGITRAIDVLRSGGVVAHATETCYGLACDLRNAKAVERLFMVKDRPFTQPVSALFSTLDEAKAFVLISPKALEPAEKHLPGPLTLVLPIRSDPSAPMYVRPSTESLSPSVGVRISSHPVAMQLSLVFGGPLATTSANVHGRDNPYSIDDITSQFLGREACPDLLLDSGVLPMHAPSSVVQVIGDLVSILRQGEIAVEV